MENQHKNNAIESIQELHKDWKIAEEKVVELKKENKELMNGFDTDTHILVEREKLQAIIDNADELSSNANYTEDYIESAESSISDARYNSGDMVNQASDISGDLEKLLKSTKGEENE